MPSTPSEVPVPEPKPIRVELLGGLRVRCGETPITQFRTQKTAELLAYLAYHLHRPHPRDYLIELLWPETDLESGRHNLSVALSSLRRQIEAVEGADEPCFLATRHAIGLEATRVSTDVDDFETLLRSAGRETEEEARARSLSAAIGLYAGELLPGYYSDWVVPEQLRLDELYFDALHRLLLRLESQGPEGTQQALHFALRAAAAHRSREEAQREVIRLYAAVGNPAAALRQFHDLERRLRCEFEVQPSAETLALGEAIQAQLRSRSSSAPIPAVLAPTGRLSDSERVSLETVGGAVPLGSRFYVTRSIDPQFHQAIARGDSIVLVKGARQVGKTSLVARGLQQAREAGKRTALTHFQMFNSEHLASADTLLIAMAQTLSEQLEIDPPAGETWDQGGGANLSFRRYLRRHVLASGTETLVWALDEVDRLFTTPFGSEIFGLFRSWHDERALEPDGPWGRLTLVISYSTEAHLFITDLNQSPFNVGTRLALDDFSADQIADLNRRHGSPLRSSAELTRFRDLLGGHPYLVRSALHEAVAHGTPLDTFESRGASDEWIFGEHLRRIGLLLAKDDELSRAAAAILDGQPCPRREAFYRLRSAGVVIGESVECARLRCRLYADYLRERLTGARGEGHPA